MQYMREIDGLRAVAVLPVILFHAGFGFLSGGYVGVDIFFVISGYLITSILVGELEQNNFSIARFYERRMRRILPALFTVMLACLPFSYLWMMPSQLEDFAASIVTVTMSLSNIYFLSQVDYFAQDAELQPLLHTWSLAVEEQYYFVFPIFLFFVWKFGRRRVFWIMIGLAALSLVFAEWALRENPQRNFFFTLSRFWEIGVGSICALLPVRKSAGLDNMLGVVGIALISFSIIFYDGTTPFPSLYALVPVVGAALVILYARQGTWVASLLSIPPLVGIGLISYSAYLWHQPLFAFARLRSMSEPGELLMASLAAASLALAWVTWRYVEQPFRRRPDPMLATRRRVFAASGAAGAAFVAVGLFAFLDEGLPFRFGTDLLRYDAAVGDKAGDDCHFKQGRNLPGHPVGRCLHEQGGPTASVMLIGDSHALAVSEELGRQLDDVGISYYNVNYSGCVPIPGLKVYSLGDEHECAKFNEEAYAFASEYGIDTVVLVGRFPLYLYGNRFDNGEGGVESGEDVPVDITGLDETGKNEELRRARVLDSYEIQIRDLARKFNVVLVYPIPEAGWNVPSHVFRQVYFHAGDGVLSTSYEAYKARSVEVNSLFDRLAAEFPNVHAARVHESLCSDSTGRCMNSDGDGVYYYDDDHLSNAGARLIAPTVIAAVQAAAGR